MPILLSDVVKLYRPVLLSKLRYFKVENCKLNVVYDCFLYQESEGGNLKKNQHIYEQKILKNKLNSFLSQYIIIINHVHMIYIFNHILFSKYIFPHDTIFLSLIYMQFVSYLFFFFCCFVFLFFFYRFPTNKTIMHIRFHIQTIRIK